MQTSESTECADIIDEICGFDWESLSQNDLLNVAISYYYFSIQFYESLRVARALYPEDEKLRQLEAGECNTDNLSPWPDIAQTGETMDHFEFMRRLLTLSPINEQRRNELDRIGQNYLHVTRAMTLQARAGSIASYEDGGLENVFRAILRCRQWNGPALQAFRHFLVEHIRFDSDAEAGHGALSRHLTLDDREVSQMWLEFQRILLAAAPSLATQPTPAEATAA